jgi:hypothetical protein
LVVLASIGAPDFSGLVWFVAFCAAVLVLGLLGLIAFIASQITRDTNARARYLLWAKGYGFAVALCLCFLAVLSST